MFKGSWLKKILCGKAFDGHNAQKAAYNIPDGQNPIISKYL